VEDDVGFWGNFVVSRSTASPRDLVDGLEDILVERCTEGWLDSLPAPWAVWRVWATSIQLAERTWRDLEVASKGPVIACEVFDSDGARLDMFSDPSGHWTTYLEVKGVVSHQLLPPAPFDVDGNWLDDASIMKMNAEYEREFEAECARLRAAVPTGLAAAERALSWALDAGLAAPCPASELAARFEHEGLFVEDSFCELLACLGLRQGSS
jgi:hypothetical protein